MVWAMNEALLGDSVNVDEIWWVMVLEANMPTKAEMTERYYLSENGQEGCRRVLEDVQKSATIPMLAVNLEQIDGILQRFDSLLLEEGTHSILDIGERHTQAWLVWIDDGNGNVSEQWTWTADPEEAERAARISHPRGSPLLRASLMMLREAQTTMQRIASGWIEPIWLDLRDEPRKISAAALLERKLIGTEHAH